MIERRRLIGLLIAAGLAAIGCGPSGWANDAKGKSIHVRIKGRKVVAPKGPIRVKRGDVVELSWETDERVEIHLHGYDLKLTVHPGKPAKMTVPARVAGRFPITSHGWGAQGHGHDALTYLEVHPR